MKLKVNTSLKVKETPAKKVSAVKPKEKKSLKDYSDEYRPLFKPMRLLVRETPSRTNPTTTVKQYVEIKAIRYGEDGLPYVFLSMYQESESYTGYMKGKGLYFPLEQLYTVMETLEDFSEACDKHKIS